MRAHTVQIKIKIIREALPKVFEMSGAHSEKHRGGFTKQATPKKIGLVAGYRMGGLRKGLRRIS